MLPRESWIDQTHVNHSAQPCTAGQKPRTAHPTYDYPLHLHGSKAKVDPDQQLHNKAVPLAPARNLSPSVFLPLLSPALSLRTFNGSIVSGYSNPLIKHALNGLS